MNSSVSQDTKLSVHMQGRENYRAEELVNNNIGNIDNDYSSSIKGPRRGVSHFGPR